MTRRQTMNFEKGDGKFGTLSYEKMVDVVNREHPRRNGELIPLCISTGRLHESNAGKNHVDGLDELGIGVSMYFKLLKSLIWFFSVCFILNIPLMFIYSRGLMSN